MTQGETPIADRRACFGEPVLRFERKHVWLGARRAWTTRFAPGRTNVHSPFLEPFHSAVIFAVPMFHSVEKQVTRAFRAHIQARYGIDFAAGIEQSRQSDFDMAVPAEFQLAKQLRQSSSGSQCSAS